MEKNVSSLESNYNDMLMIHVGEKFSALPNVLKNIIVAYTLDDSQALFLFLRLLHGSYGLYYFRTTVGVEENGRKHFSPFEDSNYILQYDEVSSLTKSPRESNIELLRDLLVTDETNFLLLNSTQEVFNHLICIFSSDFI